MKSIIDDITDIASRLRELEGKPLESKFKCQECRDTQRVQVKGTWYNIYEPCSHCVVAIVGNAQITCPQCGSSNFRTNPSNHYQHHCQDCRGYFDTED